jgi:crotonobetainyl-CoA:carnitine CoA-transferase CaiB-like acyl-CoA transferase
VPSESGRGGLRAAPLAGVRVLDLSRMVAGGLAAMLLADFGADVVKVEQPRVGDPLRQWTTEGVPFWWRVYQRNKRFITLDLKSDEGRRLLSRMVPRFDVLIESFVPGGLEELGLGWDTLRGWNDKLILVRISGWGQTGPGRERPGFGTLVEAASGFAAMNGEAGGAPLVPAFPLADMSAALYAANAITMALYDRDLHEGRGQVIDVSLFEALFSLLGPLPAEYVTLGQVRTRQGSRSKNAGPRGCFRTRDGAWIAVSGSTPKMAERFLTAYGLEALLSDPRFATNEARVRHADELNRVVGEAIGARTKAENEAIIAARSLTATPVQTIADILTDPHWRARGLTVNVPGPEGEVAMHAVVPRMSGTPGVVRRVGGALGQDNGPFFTRELGLGDDDLARLEGMAVI